MKIVTQKDFQNLYKSPGTEETEEMNRTLANLPEKKIPERVPVIRRRRVAFILAVVMALMGVAAVATGFLNRTLVSWDAKPTETEGPTTGWTDEEWQSVSELLNTYPKDEVVVASKKGGNDYFYNNNNIPVSSLEELLQVLDEAGYPHPETLVPDGWEFSGAEIGKALTPEGKNELIEESESADGKYIIQRYRIDKQHQVVTGYTITLKKGEREVRFGSSAVTKETIPLLSIAYPVDGEVHAEKPSIPGMEDVLFTNYKDFSDLIMYRPLEKPIQVNRDLYGFATEVETKDYELIGCRNLDPEEVTSLFAETK